LNYFEPEKYTYLFPYYRREKVEHVCDLIEQGKLTETELLELKKKVDARLAC